MVVFNFSVLEPLNVNILMCQSPDESILKNFNFFSHGKVIFDNLDVPEPTQTKFGNLHFFFTLKRLFLIDLIFQGLDESILENFNFFA